MHTFYGIWLDHSSAFLIKANKLAEMEIDEMQSGIEPHHRGNPKRNDSPNLTAENSHNERQKQQMHAFSKELMKRVQNADEIMLFGPGTAKNEVKNELEKLGGIAEKLKGVETTDKLSEAEMKDFVKNFFNLPRE